MPAIFRSGIILAPMLVGLVLLYGCFNQPDAGLGSGAFVSETLVDGLAGPTDFAFAPDGRIFIAQKEGLVSVYKDGELLPDPFIELTVNAFHERGLLGLALDPQFATNGYVYLFYVVENSAGEPSGPTTAQVLRVTADGDVAAPGSEFVVLGSVVSNASQPSCSDFPAGSDCIPADAPSHAAGGLRFTSDGKLMVAIGDAEQLWPAQDLDSLYGKIVRVNPDGTAPLDNPFFTGDPNAIRSKIWAYGLRNPFRFGLQPGSDLPFIGDVGSSYEEINEGKPGANFGWPCYSNTMLEHPDKLCEELDAAGGTTLPLYAYLREEPGAAVIAGVFYQEGSYPSEYDGAFFFGDFVLGTISSLKVDSNNSLIPDSVTEIVPDAGSPVDFEIGPDGDLYYLSINDGEVRRLCFVPDGDEHSCRRR